MLFIISLVTLNVLKALADEPLRKLGHATYSEVLAEHFIKIVLIFLIVMLKTVEHQDV